MLRRNGMKRTQFHWGAWAGQGWAILCQSLQRGWVASIKRGAIALVLLGTLLWGGLVAPAHAEDYNKENLVDSDFSHQVLTDSSFTKANLRNSNFSYTNLRGVSLFGANLENVNLEGADLSYATLDSARLVRANLKNAVLEGAFAFSTKFDGATIDGADFTDVLLRSDVQDQLCAIASGTNPTTGRDTRDSLDCY